MTLINNLHLDIYIAKVKDHDFYRWGIEALPVSDEDHTQFGQVL